MTPRLRPIFGLKFDVKKNWTSQISLGFAISQKKMIITREWYWLCHWLGARWKTYWQTQIHFINYATTRLARRSDYIVLFCWQVSAWCILWKAIGQQRPEMVSLTYWRWHQCALLTVMNHHLTFVSHGYMTELLMEAYLERLQARSVDDLIVNNELTTLVREYKNTNTTTTAIKWFRKACR